LSSKRLNRAILAIMLTFIALSLAYSVVNPLHEATDELRHYRFVQHIVQRGSLPVQGEVGCSAQGHHPPLYYAAAALASSWIDTGRDVCYEPPTNPFWAHRYWDVGVDNKNQYMHGEDEAFPWSGEALAAHLARLVNILIGAGVVFVTFLIGRTIWPQRSYLALGGAAIVAFNPMFLYMAGAINNDVIAALAGAAITLAAVRLLRDEEGLHWRWGIIFGVLYGLALLSKFNLAAIIVTIELAITWVAWRKKQWRQWVLVNGLLVIFALLLAGWWFARNQVLYGEPTGIERLTELWGVRDPADSLELALIELPYVWTSLWGRFGYGQIPLPSFIYNLLGVLGLLSLIGLFIPLLRRDKEELSAYGPYLLLLLANVGLFFAVIFNYLLVSPAGPMGRFFFPALPSLALLMIYGLSRWLALLPATETSEQSSRGMILTAVVTVGLLAIALIALFGYLSPAYARPPEYAQADLPNENNASFEGLVTLLGYEIGQESVSPGEDLDVTLYWEVTAEPPGDYFEFVHLIDEQGFMVAQRDTHPGLGRFPASQWKVGDRFEETVTIEIPEVAYTPAKTMLSAGFYAPQEGYRLGVYAPDGTLLGDALELGGVSVVPASGTGSGQIEIPNAQRHSFADELLLLGYEYERRQLTPGQPLGVTLYWQALAGEIPDYEVQLRLLDESGWIMETLQERPLDGNSSTADWTAGEIMVDRHELPINSAITPGVYRVQVALQQVEDNKRPMIVDEDGRWLYDKLQLAELRIAP
jgi:4-amino-4-deoxy-L-arabinose transferase-like glycosyltransferase